MKKSLISLCLILSLLLSLTVSFGAVSVNQVFSYSDPNWGKGNNVTADGLWRYEWYARETGTFAAMDWEATGKYYEAQFTTAEASDTHWYCRVRSNGTNLHPGAQADATVTFVAPETGKVQYSVNLTRQAAPNPNGNTVRVMVNDKIIPINGAEDYLLDVTATLSVDLNFDVQKGDLVRLMIGSQGNSSADGVNFSGLKVKYLSGANLEPEKPSYTITCVGDSITEGYGTTGGFKGVNAFPFVLKGLLNKTGVADFDVINCGKSATTALVKGDRPYKECAEYRTSLKSDPDIVIICLGANDSKAANWNADNYRNDYYNLICEYLNLPSKPTVYLFYTTYVADQSKTGCRRTVIQNEIMPIQYELAEELDLKIIDLNTLTKNNSKKYTDGVHPNDELQAMMAEYIYNALCSEGVCGLSAKNATATVTMIDPAKEAANTNTSTSTNTSSSTVSGSDNVTDGTTTDSGNVTDAPSDGTTSALPETDTPSDGTESAGTVTDSASSDASADSADDGESSGALLWIVLGAVVLVAAGVAVFFVLKKKK